MLIIIIIIKIAKEDWNSVIQLLFDYFFIATYKKAFLFLSVHKNIYFTSAQAMVSLCQKEVRGEIKFH